MSTKSCYYFENLLHHKQNRNVHSITACRTKREHHTKFWVKEPSAKHGIFVSCLWCNKLKKKKTKTEPFEHCVFSRDKKLNFGVKNTDVSATCSACIIRTQSCTSSLVTLTHSFVCTHSRNANNVTLEWRNLTGSKLTLMGLASWLQALSCSSKDTRC